MESATRKEETNEKSNTQQGKHQILQLHVRHLELIMESDGPQRALGGPRSPALSSLAPLHACSFPPVMTHSSGTSSIWAPHWSLAFIFTPSHNGFSGLSTVTPTLLHITCSSGNSSARLQDPLRHASFTAVCHYHVGDILQNSALLASIDYRYIDVCVRAMVPEKFPG